MLAAVGDTPYRIFLLLHIASAMVAFGPVFVDPFLARRGRGLGSARAGLMTQLARNGRLVSAPALMITGILGFGVAGLSDEVYKMSQPWLAASFVFWVAMNGVLHAVLIPAERALADDAATDEVRTSAERRVDLAGGAIALLLVVVVVIMVFKPGV